jgi:hypothetical protein
MTNKIHIGGQRPIEAIALGIFLLHGAVFGMTSPIIPKSEQVVITLKGSATDAEIQDALDTLPAAGGVVVLPAGDFVIRQPIVLKRDNQKLRGSGTATVLRLANDANCPVIIMGEPVNNPRKTVRHLRVADLFIDGNRRNQHRENWGLQGDNSEIRNNGITVQRVSDSMVENVGCADCRSGGLVTTLGVRGLMVKGLTAFDNQFDGLACYDTKNSTFSDLYLHDNPGAGISLDLAFDHNIVSNAVLVANSLGIFMRASRENQFHNVTIRNSHHFGVYMSDAEDFTTGSQGKVVPESECTLNAFTNLTATNCGGAAFCVDSFTCTNNVILRPSFARNRMGNLALASPNLVTVQ